MIEEKIDIVVLTEVKKWLKDYDAKFPNCYITKATSE
jgi:hypothetical protein